MFLLVEAVVALTSSRYGEEPFLFVVPDRDDLALCQPCELGNTVARFHWGPPLPLDSIVSIGLRLFWKRWGKE